MIGLVKRIFKNVLAFSRSNPLEFWTLVIILAVGAFCRLYKISGYMTFLGDEGRDVIIVRRLLVEGHPPLIGPGTSIGNMYLGPLYYYMMAPALLFANFSPVGPAVMIALLGIITIWFVWYTGRIWFGNVASLVAAGIYAISPTVITYSRSSWNPNIMPFFALLCIYSIWKVWRDSNYSWLVVLGVSFAFVLQSHYLGLLLAPTLIIFYVLGYLKAKSPRESSKAFKFSVYGMVAFLALMSPLFFFDLRHNWINSRAMYTFFTVRQTTVSIRPWTAIPSFYPQFSVIMSRLVGGQNVVAGEVASILAIASLLYVIVVNWRKIGKINPAYFLLFSWIGFGILGLALYKQNIYDHYYGFIFAVPYFLIGIAVSILGRYKMIGKVAGLIAVAYLVFVNVMNSPLRYAPNNQLQRAFDVAKKIEEESGGNRFNLGVIAERNYEDGYKYFLLKDKASVVDIDSQVKGSITNQLFAVCELSPTSKCDPTHNSSAAVANFGWSKIDSSWEVDGVIVYKLVHTKS